MARKKKQSLEKEFAKRLSEHKNTVIMGALIETQNQKLYNHKLLKKYKDMPVTFLEGHENEFTYEQTKALLVAEDLEDRAMYNGEQEIFDKVYELCWKHTECKDRYDIDFRTDEDNE